MIHNIETLPFVTFIKIIETDDYYLLLKERSVFNWVNKLKVKFFKLDLQKAFEEIREEYKDDDNSLRTKKINSLKRKFDKLNSEYRVVMLSLETLKYGEDAEMLEILKEKGYKLDKKDGYIEGLLTIYRQVENLKNKIEAIKNEIDGYLEDNGDEEVKPQKILINLLTQLELSLKVNDITVTEYLCYKQVLSEKIKQSKKQSKNK